MRLNRREFVWVGAAGTVGMLAGCGKNGALPIRLRGLCLVERSGKSITVHVVDAGAVGLGTHEPCLSVSKAIIDTAKTTAPSLPDAWDSTRLVFGLGGPLTLDTGITGTPDLEVNTDPVIMGTLPQSDAEWKSVQYAASMKTLCGATKVTASASTFVRTLTIEHGLLHSIKPESFVGQNTIWEFKKQISGSPDEVVSNQALSDTLLCTVPVRGSSATFMIGTQPLVVNVGTAGDVMLRNLPPAGTAGMCSGTPPCVDHMEVYYNLVDFAFKPVAKGALQRPMPPSAEPDYCPLGEIG